MDAVSISERVRAEAAACCSSNVDVVPGVSSSSAMDDPFTLLGATGFDSKSENPLKFNRDLKFSGLHVEQITSLLFAESGRPSLPIIIGAPGSGKTRVLCEVGRRLSDEGVLVLTATFNGMTAVDRSFDPCLFSYSQDLALVLRLLYVWFVPAAAKTRTNWYDWSPKAFQIIKDNQIQITLSDVIDKIRTITRNPNLRIAVLVDETLLALRFQIAEEQVQALLQMAYRNYQPNVAMVFSVMSGTIFSDAMLQEFSTSSRFSLAYINLAPLSPSDIMSILQDYCSRYPRVSQSVDALATASMLQAPQILETIMSLVSGSPRALDFCVHSLRYCSPTTLMGFLPDLGVKLQLACPLPNKRAVLQAIVGAEVALTDPSPVLGLETVHEALRVGGLIEHRILQADRQASLLVTPITPFEEWHSRHPTKAIVDLSECQALAFVIDISRHYGLSDDEEFTSLCDLILLPLFRPENIWREFFRRREIVIRLAWNKYRIAPRSWNPSHDGFVSLSCLYPSKWTGSSFASAMVVPEILDVVMKRWDIPPSPAELKENPSLHHRVWVPENPREPGVDSVLFFQKFKASSDAAQGDTICVGIQSNMSERSLEKEEAEEAMEEFRASMLARGWEDTNIFMVFIARRIVDSSGCGTIDDTNLAVISLDDKDSVALWLGPLMNRMSESVQTLSTSSSHRQQSYMHKQEEIQDYVTKRKQNLCNKFRA